MSRRESGEADLGSLSWKREADRISHDEFVEEGLLQVRLGGIFAEGLGQLLTSTLHLKVWFHRSLCRSMFVCRETLLQLQTTRSVNFTPF